MKLVLALITALALVGAARADGVRVVTLAAVEDLSLPFQCDWGYDWDERCFGDDSTRLRIGGVDDKVWRSALRFSLDELPPDGRVVAAELSLWYDQTCVAPRRKLRACDGRGYDFTARPIYSPRWLAEREVVFGPVLAYTSLEPEAPPGWLVWDLTDLVAEWQAGETANNGVLLALADEEEVFDSSGPAFPSSTHPDVTLRPRLTVSYLLE